MEKTGVIGFGIAGILCVVISLMIIIDDWDEWSFCGETLLR